MIQLVRRPDWNHRLTEFLVWCQQVGVRLDWKVFNCGSWSSRCVELQTDYDFYAPFRDKVVDEASAYKEIKKAGYEDLESVITSQFPTTPIGMAQKGDVVFVPADGDQYCGLGMSYAIGIADPPFFWALGTGGLGRGSLYECEQAFAVGER